MALNYAKTNTFVTGTAISSAAVNANFDDVVNAFGGLENLSKSLTNLLVDTVLRSAGTIQSADGTVLLPGLTFTSGTTDGLYRIGTNNFGFATNGVKRLDISTSAITAALPMAMGANKITGLAAPTAAGDALRFENMHLMQIPIFASETTGGSTTSASFVVKGATASITPTSASSKILIMGMGLINVATSTDGHTGHLGIARGGTELFARTASPSAHITGSQSSTAADTQHIFYLDSPATTSSTAYQLMISSGAGDTVNFGGAAATGSATYILLAEVG